MTATNGQPTPVTPADNRSPDAWADFWSSSVPRRLAVTLAILAAYRTAALWPAAGINPAALFASNAHFDQFTVQLAEKLSPVALGLIPVFTILSILEVAKLALPTLKYWIDASIDNRHAFHRRVLVASLLLAAFQAYGIAIGLSELHQSQGAISPPLLVVSGTSFYVAFMTAEVVGTALCLWLADQITRFGLGSGFWVLYIMPSLIGFALLPGTLKPLLESGAVQAHMLIVTALALVATALAIATLARQWMKSAPETIAAKTAPGHFAMTDALSIVIWPPFLAVGIAGLFASIVTSLGWLFGAEATGTRLFAPASIEMIVLVAALIWLLTRLIASSVLKPAHRDAPATHRLIQQTALVTSATYATIEILVWRFDVPSVFYGPGWVALVTVLTLLVPLNVSRYVPSQATDELTDDDFSSA